MLVWIVNPFDPLPGDPEQDGRYATLAKLLARRGHRVVWWTSAFSHRFKRPVDQAALTEGCRAHAIEPRFLEGRPYRRNVGLARLRNHADLARGFMAAAAAERERPNVIVASTPPPGLARAAVEFAADRGVASIVDIQDAWPDAFVIVAPRIVRPALAPVIRALRRDLRRAARGCDAIVGVADAYVANLTRELDAPKEAATIPLGIDLATFDAAAAHGRCAQWTKPPGEIWVAYTGSLNRNYDFLTILRAAAPTAAQFGPRVRFFLTGRGELEPQARELVSELSLTNVTITGFLDFPTWAYLLTQCDVGFNASFPETMIYLPNKVFYYLAAGAAVLNTIPGQCSAIVREAGCGLDYEARNPESCAAAIAQVVADGACCARMRQAARRAAETSFDRAVLYPRYAELIERLGTR
ncbi:MAG: glycosyltransferase [Planctomycetota bacterium]